MRQNESSYTKLKDKYQIELNYEPHQAEGQCTMLFIVPVRFIQWRFILYLILNVILLIPLLLTYWNDKYKKFFYMKFCSLDKATHFYILNYDDQVSIVKKQSKLFTFNEKKRSESTYFVNRYMTYYIDNQSTVKLSVYDYHQRLKQLADVQRQEKGLTTQKSLQLKDTFGLGTMVIKKPTLLQIAIDEIVQPLYIFLIFSVLFWYIAQGYIYFATTLLVVFLVGVIINLHQIVQLNEKIFSMAYYEIQLNVLRNGSVKKTSSLDVVPGDIVFLRDPIKLSFQGIILQGSALINQCALTGQSVPVVKKADRFSKIAENPAEIDKNAFIFEGTTIIQVSDKKPMTKFQKYRKDYGIPVCVIKTNFVTTKGQLIRIILFPKEQQNSFQRESSKFLFVLFFIAMISYTVLVIINYEYETSYDIIIKFIDLVLIAVPPALPVSMTFGIIYALERLQKKKIFCIAQNKVITGGLIEFACFDKTGTLTQEYMDFYCVVPSYAGKFHTQVANTEEMSQYMIQNITKKPYYLPILNNMAANHSIIKIQTTNELIGDPMEIKSFNFGQFDLNQSPEDNEVIFGFESKRNHKGSVYRRYEFESDLQRMSVIIKSNFTEGFHVYSKGSPQMMVTIMQKASIPKNYNDILKEYASHGFRVLAISSKGITQEQMKDMTRQKAQMNLVFNGFEIFQNPLKKETTGAIKQLKQARIGCVMITGDNTLTGSNISYKCTISQKEKGMIIIDFIDGRLNEETFVFHDYENTQAFPMDKPIAQSYIEQDIRVSLMSKERSSKRNSSFRQSSQLSGFEPMRDNHGEFMFNLTIKSQQNHCQLCITGRAFNQLFPGSVSNLTIVQKKFMDKATVFARTKPNDKAKIVMVFQQMGKKVSMCGDGANDCGALKQADIGLSLSQAEASISAPFTSQITNITSMVEVIKQCRAGLATNFSLFNIMAIYSLTQFSTTILTEIYLQYPADFQFLYWDAVCNFTLIIFVGYTATADVLSIQRPRNSLFSFTNLFQVIFMFIVQFVSQYIAIFLYSKVEASYYSQYGGIDNGRQNYIINKKEFNLDGVQTSILFAFTNNIYLFTLLAFNISSPWRKAFYTNIPLIISALLIFIYNTILFFIQPARLQILTMHFWPTTKVEIVVFLWSFTVSLFLYVNQKCILQPISRKLIRKYPKLTWL